MAKYCIDIEADNLLLDVTKIHCIVLMDIDSREVYSFGPDQLDKAVSMLENADLLIAHNGIMYDLPVIQKFYPNFKYDPKKVFDTFLVSSLLYPDRDGGHSLRAWGERVGSDKIDFTDFTQYSEEMLEYCKRDVEVTYKVFQYLKEDAREVLDAVYTENQFAYYITKQILRGFKLDLKKVKALYTLLNIEAMELENTLKAMMPAVPQKTHYNGVRNKELLLEEDATGYSYITEKTRVVKRKKFKFEEPNPTSRTQIIEYLRGLGWIPKEFTDKGTPKVDETILSGLPYESAKMFARLFRLQKLTGMIENPRGGWLHYERNGRVHGDVRTIGANTSRCTHSKPNMAQVDKKDGRMREVWIAEDGYKLVGFDAAGIELRLLGHYLAPYDKGRFAYKASQPKDVVDLHTDNQIAAGLANRDSAKTLIYALIYGAGNGKLGTIFADDRGITISNDQELIKQGALLRSNLIEELQGYDKLMKDVEKAFKARGSLRSIDGRPLYPRSEYSALNLLIQSAGAIIMKRALVEFVELCSSKGYQLDEHYHLVANVHDEVQCEVKEGLEHEIGKLGVGAIKKAGQYYKLHVDLDGEYLVGSNWGETH